jgi:endoglucanase
VKLFVFFFGLLISWLPYSNALAVEESTFIPSNPPGMKRLTNRSSHAYEAARQYLRGVNLGNYLESPPVHSWGVTVKPEEFGIMKAEGFDHVRVPVRWNAYTGAAPDYILSPDIFARVDFVVTNALANRLAVILNIHDFDAFTSDPSGQTDKLVAIWRQIAEHYANAGPGVAFELLNEPKDAATTTVMNPIFARTIAEIRRTNPHRTIFVGPGKWNQVSELKNLVLPDDDNVIVTVHSYQPFYFTHQGATWAGPDTKVTGIKFPGPPVSPLVPDPSLQLNSWVVDWIDRYNSLPAEQNPSSPQAFAGELKLAHEWSDYYGRPVHVGEFGCFTKADPESRIHFYEAFRRECEREKLGWAIWDWSAGFRYWDHRTHQPVKGMREALFGQQSAAAAFH